MPIIINTDTSADPRANNRTHVNYKRANWDEFTNTTEQQFSELNNIDITNIDTHLACFNKIITDADKRFIPRGNIKNYNPNFTPEISILIRQLNTFKHNSPTPHTQDTVERIQHLNEQITTKIQHEKLENWKAFVQTLNHSTNTSRLYKTINSITNSNSGITKSHASITTTDNIPSLTEQANILIKHYADISHHKPIPEDRQTQRRKHKYPLDNNNTPFTTHQTSNVIKNSKTHKQQD